MTSAKILIENTASYSKYSNLSDVQLTVEEERYYVPPVRYHRSPPRKESLRGRGGAIKNSCPKFESDLFELTQKI